MNFFIFKKISIFYILLFFILSCNYKPLFDESRFGQLNFKNIEIKGDKRAAQIIVNKLNVVKNQSGKFSLFIDAEKKRNASNKSTSGKVLEYSITLNHQVKIKNNIDGKIIYSKKITSSENFKTSSNYSDTVNSEKKIVENISDSVAKQILNELSLVLKNDI